MVLTLKLQKIRNETHDSRSFIFDKPAEFSYLPGQYNRWRLDHPNSDNRGITRPFSISSSPTEDCLMFTTKRAPEQGSSYKETLFGLKPGVEFWIEGPKGDFVLPDDPNQPIVFLGGGVGITPFRSMIKFATDKKSSTPLTLIYANKTLEDIIYRDEFNQWDRVNSNFKVIYTLDQAPEGWGGETGRLTGEMIGRCVADLASPQYFICGPEGMINAYQEVLFGLGVTPAQIRTENFSGY